MKGFSATSIVIFSVLVLVSASTSQFVFANGSNVTPTECDPGDFKDDDIPDSETKSTDPDNTGMIIDGLCIKAGGGMDDHGEFITNNGLTADGCFDVSGLGTTVAMVLEDFDTGENCMDLSHVDYVKDGMVGGHGGITDNTALLVSGSHLTASWMIPLLVSAIGIGVFIVTRK